MMGLAQSADQAAATMAKLAVAIDRAAASRNAAITRAASQSAAATDHALADAILRGQMPKTLNALTRKQSA